MPFAGPPDDIVDRARLAAQAPAMARLLLEREFSYDGVCWHCSRSRSEGHATGCEPATVLRAAGVLP